MASQPPDPYQAESPTPLTDTIIRLSNPDLRDEPRRFFGDPEGYLNDLFPNGVPERVLLLVKGTIPEINRAVAEEQQTEAGFWPLFRPINI
jgi:hypothetical protein